MYINNVGHMTKVAAMPIYGKPLPVSSSLKPIDFNETWREASMAIVLQPCDDLDQVYGKVNMGCPYI